MTKTIKLIFSICLFSLLSFSTNAIEGWKKEVYAKLPSFLRFIEIKKTTFSDVQKKLGKASFIKENKQYYELGGFRYALEVTYKDQVITDFHYTFYDKQPSYSPLRFDNSKLDLYPETGSSSGMYLKYTDKEGEIVIEPREKTILSVKFK